MVLPYVVARSGELTKLEIIKEYRPSSGTAAVPAVPCGIMIDVVPVKDGGQVCVSGKGLLRRPTNKNAEGVATRFEAQEVLIDEKLEVGVPKSIDLEGGGKMVLTATLMDASGRPLKH